MAARAIWKGIIRLGDVLVPVKLYGAVEEKSIHFRLLHKKDLTPVRQEMVHPETGEVVPAEAICRGYATEEGEMVILTDEELKGLEPESSRDIEIIRFLPFSAINHRWFERPYFLGPDGDPEAYFALAAALKSAGTEGLARWSMRSKEYFGILRLEKGYPVLITLRHAEEVVQLADLKIPAGREVDKKELALAEQIVSAMADSFDPAQYKDEYRERVMGLIAGKASGKIVRLQKSAPKKNTGDLKKALEGSLQIARERRHGSSKKV
ncbi:MAG: non-homologous end joining protein Ku [Desulfobulbaceae bacterium]